MFELSGSPIARRALTLIAKLYEIEHELKELKHRLLNRQQQAKTWPMPQPGPSTAG